MQHYSKQVSYGNSQDAVSSETTDEWIKEMCYLYTMKIYSATKKNEILSFVGKWMELENINLCEDSQAQKAKTLIFFFHICK
jgi:hypothetical protein